MLNKHVGGKDLSKLWGFLISYFGDYREGKSEKDILDEAIHENSKDYLLQVFEQLDILKNLELPTSSKKEFLLSANIYMESEEGTSIWIDLIHTYLRDKLQDSATKYEG